jgi:uncharacterized protein (TIGR02594 family)
MNRHTAPVKVLQQLLNTKGAGLIVDGAYGPKTEAAIDSLHESTQLKIALKEIGVFEIHGKDNSSRILEYTQYTAGKYSNDETPWCGAFMAWVVAQAGMPASIQFPERALAWKDYGYQIPEPVSGCIAVKSRKGGGHVTMVVGMDNKGNLLCVGGNQNDEVNISAYPLGIFETFVVPNVQILKLTKYDVVLNGTAIKES